MESGQSRHESDVLQCKQNRKKASTKYVAENKSGVGRHLFEQGKLTDAQL